MEKKQKLLVNLSVFLLVGVFILYVVKSINKDEQTYAERYPEADYAFVSPYELIAEFSIPAVINRIEYDNGRLLVVAGNTIYSYTERGEELLSFSVKPDVRDITIEGDEIYALYPTFIEVYSKQGEPLRQWEACSDLSDYCSLAVAGDYLFVTDAQNKNICKYTKEGNFVKFIFSPRGFIIPSYAFDIASHNDTIFCSNSGRHLIESYTLEGDFIAAFGGPGGDAGHFAGCCNPAFLTFSSEGLLLTSEKGNPRISSFDKTGSFRSVLINSRLLGGGSDAREIRSYEDRLYVAGKNKISVFKQKELQLNG